MIICSYTTGGRINNIFGDFLAEMETPLNLLTHSNVILISLILSCDILR